MVLRNKESLLSTLAEEEAIKKQYEQVKQSYDNGLTSITVVHESRAAYDLVISKRLVEEINLEMANENLTLLTGKKHKKLKTLSENFEGTYPTPNDIESWIKFSSENNLEIDANSFKQKSSFWFIKIRILKINRISIS